MENHLKVSATWEIFPDQHNTSLQSNYTSDCGDVTWATVSRFEQSYSSPLGSSWSPLRLHSAAALCRLGGCRCGQPEPAEGSWSPDFFWLVALLVCVLRRLRWAWQHKYKVVLIGRKSNQGLEDYSNNITGGKWSHKYRSDKNLSWICYCCICGLTLGC